jgi:hypothetical protein
VPRVAELPKLDPRCAHQVGLWEHELAHASCAAFEEIERQSISVVVEHRGSIEPLRAAGMSTGHDANGRVSGAIAIRDLPKLVAIDDVTAVVFVPPVEPL